MSSDDPPALDAPDTPGLWVYVRGDARLDALLDLGAGASVEGPARAVLGGLCARIATAVEAEVVSIYVRERDPFLARDELVLRGNVGFPAAAVGTVRLSPGEGIIGYVVECGRPVTCSIASDDPHYAHVAGLGEERFPSFLAVPVIAGEAIIGVLAVQRRQPQVFPHADVRMAVALSGGIARILERLHAPRPPSSAALDGVGVVGGVAQGSLQALPSHDIVHGVSGNADAITAAFASVASELDDARRRIQPALPLGPTRQLVAITAILHDQRLRDLALAHSSSSVATGLRRAVRQRCGELAVEQGREGPWLLERAAELSDLSLLVAARTAGAGFPARGRIVVAERLSIVLTLAMLARGAGGCAVSEQVDPHGVPAALLRAAGVPTVAEVAGLGGLADREPVIAVDGGAGLVSVLGVERVASRVVA